jgi:hypothetical protein
MKPADTPDARFAPDLATARLYAQNRVVRIAWPIAAAVLLATTAAVPLLAAAGAWREAADAPFLPLTTLLLAVATLWLLLVSLSVNRRIRVDQHGIQRVGLFGACRIDWPEVTELTLGGTATFAEGALGTKLFVEGRNGRLVTFTSRLGGVGELVEIIEARTGLAFASPQDEAILPISHDPKETDRPADDRPPAPKP